jgi:hypothetical protein
MIKFMAPEETGEHPAEQPLTLERFPANQFNDELRKQIDEDNTRIIESFGTHIRAALFTIEAGIEGLTDNSKALGFYNILLPIEDALNYGLITSPMKVELSRMTSILDDLSQEEGSPVQSEILEAKEKLNDILAHF